MAGWRHPKDYRLITAAAPWPEQPTHLPSACREEKGGSRGRRLLYVYVRAGWKTEEDRSRNTLAMRLVGFK